MAVNDISGPFFKWRIDFMIVSMKDWFYDIRLKCWENLEMWHQWTIIMKDWFCDSKLKCWKKLYMFEVYPSTEDFDLESILWIFVEMLSSVDPPTHKLDPKLFLRFQVEILRKLFELDPGWLFDFKLTCRGKLVELDPGWFYDLSWNVVKNQRCWKLTHKQLTLTLNGFYDFKLKY